MTSEDTLLYTLPNNQLIGRLDCESTFNSLTLKENTYTHYLSQAAWNGGLISFVQASPEAPLLLALLLKFFLAESISKIKSKAVTVGITEDDFTFMSVGMSEDIPDSLLIKEVSLQKLYDLMNKYNKVNQLLNTTIEECCMDQNLSYETLKKIPFSNNNLFESPVIRR